MILIIGTVLVLGGGVTVWSWAKSQPWAPRWMRRNRKPG